MKKEVKTGIKLIVAGPALCIFSYLFFGKLYMDTNFMGKVILAVSIILFIVGISLLLVGAIKKAKNDDIDAHDEKLEKVAKIVVQGADINGEKFKFKYDVKPILYKQSYSYTIDSYVVAKNYDRIKAIEFLDKNDNTISMDDYRIRVDGKLDKYDLIDIFVYKKN